MTARCERFANQLRGRYRLPVEDVDERYSSTEADAGLRERGLSWQERKARDRRRGRPHHSPKLVR
jgi:putative Holliday junction resolvase